MSEPIPITAGVDTERLVSKLLDAINSFKKISGTPVARVLPWTNEDQPQPAPEFQVTCAEMPQHVDEAPPVISAERAPGPKRPLKLLIRPEPDREPYMMEEREPDNIFEEESAEPEETPAYETDAEPSSELSVIEEFRGDREALERLGVTHQELQALSRVSLLGSLTSKQDVLFMLRQIREAGGEPSEIEETAQLEPSSALDETPDFGERAHHIRRAAQEKLLELESLKETEPVTRWRRINPIRKWRNRASSYDR